MPAKRPAKQLGVFVKAESSGILLSGTSAFVYTDIYLGLRRETLSTLVCTEWAAGNQFQWNAGCQPWPA